MVDGRRRELIVRTGNGSVEKVGMLLFSFFRPQTIISQPPHIRNALLSRRESARTPPPHHRGNRPGILLEDDYGDGGTSGATFG